MLYVLAGMNGIDLADAARVFRPGLPLVFVSGYTAVPEAQNRINTSGAPFLSETADVIAAGTRDKRGYAPQPPRYFEVLSHSASG